jgi:hypothetical protein
VGGVGGPVLALMAMAYFASDFIAAVWVAVVPALLCVVLIAVGVEEPARPVGESPARPRQWRFADAGVLPAAYWFVVAIAVVLTLARFGGVPRSARRTRLHCRARPGGDVDVARLRIAAYPAGVAADRGRGPLLWAAGRRRCWRPTVLARAQGSAGAGGRRALGLHMA